jgi:hypothetical protein
LIIVWSAIIPRYFHQDNYIIKNILYTTSSLSIYDDPSTYTTISWLYKQKSITSVKRFNKKSIEEEVITKFPYISSVAIKKFLNNKLTLDIQFIQPSAVAILSNKRFALYENSPLLLYSGNTLGQKSPSFYLPSYLSGTQFLSGMLYSQSLDKITKDITLLSQLSLSGSITYVPGWEKYIYRTETRHIYFNAKKSLTDQIDNLQNLIQTYPKFSTLTRIDLGSNDLITVR